LLPPGSIAQADDGFPCFAHMPDEHDVVTLPVGIGLGLQQEVGGELIDVLLNLLISQCIKRQANSSLLPPLDHGPGFGCRASARSAAIRT
jgi:hypothetical protein